MLVMIVQGHEVDRPFTGRTHTAVVGSGAGGAVVAAILAEAGVNVSVVEEGGYYRAADFTQRYDEMYRKLYRDGGVQLTEDGMINVLQGSCFGGSTVINMSDCVPTPPQVYAHWERLVGISEINERTLADSQSRVLEALQVSRITDEQVNENNRLVSTGATRLGHRTATFDHNRVGCRNSGYCLIGCSYDVKQGAHLTYLPRALAAGATVHTDVRVEWLELLPLNRLRVHGSIVERANRAPRLAFELEAERVVLAAGAVHSPAVLKRSGLDRGLPQLGRNLSLQPQMLALAGFDDGRNLVPWRGIPQSVYCDAFDDNRAEHGLGGYRVEGVYGSVAHVANDLAGFGADHKRRMAEAERIGGALVLVPDQPSGRLGWNFSPKRGYHAKIRYQPTGEWHERLRRGLRLAAEIYFAAGAAWVAFGSEIFQPLTGPDDLPRIESFPLKPGVTSLISAHVQGTCRMGLSSSNSVVGQDHRLHTHPNIYVVDASVMPTSASTHTMVPIMTLADRAAHRMIKA
jgi:choline dehydrogenase-like flavoprotein